METASATAAATSTQRPSSPGAEGSDGAVLNSDFETFLKMLTTQMQNQDPLDPLDSTEFATQLATFSSVEQQVLTNDLLTALSAQMGALGVSQLAGWVGMEARAIMPVQFGGSPVTITTEGAAYADRSELVVRNAEGREVQRLQIDAARQEQLWAGVGENGAPLPYGSYDLTVESFTGQELVEEVPVSVTGQIVEARNDSGVPILVMEGGQEVESDKILGLRAPE